MSGLIAEWRGYKMSDNIEQHYYSKAELEEKQINTDLANIIQSPFYSKDR